MCATLKSSILVISALSAVVAAAETFTGRASYNLNWPETACGTGPQDGSQFLAALNPAQYGDGLGNNSPVCGQTITVTYQGKSATVKIIDMGGEGFGGLDLSVGAFEYFADLTVGIFYPTWSWDTYDPGSSGSENIAGSGSETAGTTAVTDALTSSVVPPVETPAAVPTDASAAAPPVDNSAATSSVASSGAGAATVPASVAPAVELVASAGVATDAPTSAVATTATAGRTGHGGPSGSGRQGHGRRCYAQL